MIGILNKYKICMVAGLIALLIAGGSSLAQAQNVDMAAPVPPSMSESSGVPMPSGIPAPPLPDPLVPTTGEAIDPTLPPAPAVSDVPVSPAVPDASGSSVVPSTPDALGTPPKELPGAVSSSVPPDAPAQPVLQPPISPSSDGGAKAGGDADAGPNPSEIEAALATLMAKDETPEKIILQMARDRMKEELAKLNAPGARVPSLLFTTDEQRIIDEALMRMGGANSISQKNAEGKDGEPERFSPNKQPTKKAGVRDIYVSGILYHNADDWVVWLNKWRVTPKDIPADIAFIRVTKNFVELKWKDSDTGAVVPLRMRPGQHYNLDSHSFVTVGK